MYLVPSRARAASAAAVPRTRTPGRRAGNAEAGVSAVSRWYGIEPPYGFPARSREAAPGGAGAVWLATLRLAAPSR